jgi:hypothetical protein
MDQEVYPLALHRRSVGDGELIFVAGELLALHVQAVACYSSTSLTLHSAAAVQIVERGGPIVRADAAKHLPAQVGDALLLSAGRLAMRYVMVGVTNELRAVPTLETVRAAVRAVLRRATAMELDSLALPLLRVRRRLGDDDLLVVTLAAVFAELCRAGALRCVLLLLDEEEAAARLALRRVAPLLDTLTQLGSLQAQAEALRAGYEATSDLSIARQDTIGRELLIQWLHTLSELTSLLELVASRDDLPGSEGLRVELRAYEVERARVAALLGTARERELGA